MGAEYLYTCPACGFNITTSGPWEFIRTNSGEYKYYHDSTGSCSKSIDGLSGSVYCPHCSRVYDMILAEFEEPGEADLNIWLLMADPGNSLLKQNQVKCSVCGDGGLVMEPDRNRRLDCPICGQGILEGRVNSIR